MIFGDLPLLILPLLAVLSQVLSGHFSFYTLFAGFHQALISFELLSLLDGNVQVSTHLLSLPPLGQFLIRHLSQIVVSKVSVRLEPGFLLFPILLLKFSGLSPDEFSLSIFVHHFQLSGSPLLIHLLYQFTLGLLKN